MNPEQIRLVQSTWKMVLPISDTAAAMFYERLFELDPKLRPLFTGDMSEQGRKLVAMISVAVAGLTQIDRIVGPVQELGRRHSRYGVKDKDYDTVARALLWTLEKGLDDAFTPAVKVAWIDTYGTLAGVMKEAAAKAPA